MNNRMLKRDLANMSKILTAQDALRTITRSSKYGDYDYEMEDCVKRVNVELEFMYKRLGENLPTFVM